MLITILKETASSLRQRGIEVEAEVGEAIVSEEIDALEFGEIVTTNGLLAGESLADFVHNWSRFYFMPPKSGWWGEFAKRGRIDWDASLFRSEYVQF